MRPVDGDTGELTAVVAEETNKSQTSANCYEKP